MIFLADVNIEEPIISAIRQMGHEVKAVADINIYMKDSDVLEVAKQYNAILLTNDKDFGELVFRQKQLSSGVVLLRVKGQATSEKVMLVKKLLMGFQDKIRGHFVVATRKKFRFIPIQKV